jgi:hypothetical protein
MCAFLPPYANNNPPCIMLFLLSQIGAYLGRDKTRQEFEQGDYGPTEYDASEVHGLRKINGERLEIFMNDITRSTPCMFNLIKRMLHELAITTTSSFQVPVLAQVQVNECIVEYCNCLARLDGRIVNKPYEFQNHAIIASWNEAMAQDIHIDLDHREQYQFGVLLTANSPPTLEYKAQLPVLGQNANLEQIWTDIPSNLDGKLRGVPEVQDELNSYGCLLSDPVKVSRNLDYQHGAGIIPEEDLFPIGTLISLPARVAHGGPPTTSFRAVIFFTGAPSGVEPYDSDKQSNRTMLVSNMLLFSWMDMDKEERLYLLNKWYDECLSKDKFGVANLVHQHLKKLGHCLQVESNAGVRCKLIERFAKHRWDGDYWDGGAAPAKTMKFTFPRKYQASISKL